MIKVILIDDEILNLRYLKSILDELEEIEIVGFFTKPSQVLDIIENEKIDIAFLDIELPDINGIELAVKLQNIQSNIEIVFVTAYLNYAIEAFNLHALHYLLKPVKKEQVYTLINYFKKIQKGNSYNNEILQTTKVNYFDHFRLIKPNGEEVKWPTKKTAELCAYFLLQSGKKLPKYQIIEDLWQDIDQEKASQNFHITLYRLRNIITIENLNIKIEATRGSNEGYICESKFIESDLDKFTKLFNSNKIIKSEEIYLLFKTIDGGFLEKNYYSWSERYQQEVENTLINRTHQLIREIENKDRDKAIEIVKSVLRIYRSDESLMLHYFNLLMRNGENYQILHEFEKYKKLLKQEFGLNPSLEITDFVKRIIK